MNDTKSYFKQIFKEVYGLTEGKLFYIINRNADTITEIAEKAAAEYGLKTRTIKLENDKPYNKIFPDNEFYDKLPKDKEFTLFTFFDYSELGAAFSQEEQAARIDMAFRLEKEFNVNNGHSPMASKDIFESGIFKIDYKKIKDDALKFIDSLKDAKEIHVTAPAGTDYIIDASGIEFETDADMTRPFEYGKSGKVGNIPLGEVWGIKPARHYIVGDKMTKYPTKIPVTGRVVCDSFNSMNDRTAENEDQFIEVILDNGYAEEIISCKDKEFFKPIQKTLNGYSGFLPVAEEVLGTGLNPNARLVNSLEHEKATGVGHMAISTIGYHWDMGYKNPTYIVTYKDGSKKTIMKDGKLNI